MLKKCLIQTSLFVFLLFLLEINPVQAKKAIDFTLKDLDGNTIKLSDYLQKDIILINFWATWFIPCNKELPHLQKTYDQYKAKGLRMFAISIDSSESVALVKTFISRYKYTFPVLLDTETRVVDLYNPRVIVPYTILIDKAGEIAYVHQGYSPGDENDLEEKIAELLKPKEIGEPKELSYHLNEAFLNRYFSDEDYVNRIREGRRSQVINQIDLSLTKGQYLFGIRFDSNLDFSSLKEEFSLAKRFFEFNTKNINLRVRDFYYSIGRSLVLSVLKTFEEEGLEYVIHYHLSLIRDMRCHADDELQLIHPLNLRPIFAALANSSAFSHIKGEKIEGQCRSYYVFADSFCSMVTYDPDLTVDVEAGMKIL